MAEQQHDPLVILQRAPRIAGGAAIFLAATTLLFGIRYLSLIAGAILGLVALVLVLASFWTRKALYQTMGMIVVVSAIIGLRFPILPAIQAVATTFLFISLSLMLLGPVLRRQGAQ